MQLGKIWLLGNISKNTKKIFWLHKTIKVNQDFIEQYWSNLKNTPEFRMHGVDPYLRGLLKCPNKLETPIVQTRVDLYYDHMAIYNNENILDNEIFNFHPEIIVD